MRRLLWFVVAGGIGFVVDAAVLSLLLTLSPLGSFSARVFSIAVAMAATWAINRRQTFGNSGRSLLAEGARYGGVGVTSAALNYLLYTGLLVAVPSASPLIAMTIASLLAMLWSWAGYSRFVFAPAPLSKLARASSSPAGKTDTIGTP